MCNLFQGGSLNDFRVAIPTKFQTVNTEFYHNEQDVSNSTTSKTVECSLYSFEREGYTFKFIDTPGVNDTGGFLQDDANVDLIFDTINQLNELHALILLLNGTHSRLTTNLKNVIHRFNERIPDDFCHHFIVILTNCKEYRVNFDLESSGLPLIDNSSVFYMQNSGFSHDIRRLTAQQYTELEQDWHESMSTLNNIVDCKLMKMTSFSTHNFRIIHEKLNTMKCLLHKVHLTIMDLQQIDALLSSLFSAANQYSAEMDKYHKSVEQGIVSINEVISTDYHNILCMSCNRVCHEKCTLLETSGKGADGLYQCKIFDESRDICNECTCPVSEHYHDRKLIQPVNRSIRERVQNVQQKFENVGIETATCKQDCETVSQMKKVLEDTLQDILVELRATCRHMKQININYNVSTDLQSCISRIKSNRNILTSPDVRQTADNVIQELTQLSKELNDQTSPKQLKGRTSNYVVGKRQHRSKQTRWQDDYFYIEQWSTNDLVDTYHNGYFTIRGYSYYLDDRSILKELKRRLKGDSIGFLDKRELVVFGKQFEIHHQKSDEELRTTATRIEHDIKRLFCFH